MSIVGRDARPVAPGLERQQETFESAAGSALAELRDAVAAAIASVGGERMNSLALSRHLGIDKSLSWRLARFAQEPDAFIGSRHLPGEAGLRIFVRALRAANADSRSAGRVEQASDRVEEVVRAHAGNRAAFKAMLAHCTAEPLADDRATEFRRSAFQANAALWGIEANARVMVAFLVPGDDGAVDVALVSGFIGMRRMRRDLAWPVARRRVLGHEGRTRDTIAMPLDPTVSMDAPPLLADFSTVRGEGLRPVGTEHGYWYELPEGDVGAAGAVDCFFGERMPGAGPSATGRATQAAEVMLRLDLPVEHVLLDVFVDRSLPAVGEPSAAQYGLLTGGSGDNVVDRERDRVPMAERPRPLGTDPRDWSTPVSARHWELVHDCMRWLGRRPADFRANRLEIRWPLVPTAIVVSTLLGNPPR